MLYSRNRMFPIVQEFVLRVRPTRQPREFLAYGYGLTFYLERFVPIGVGERDSLPYGACGQPHFRRCGLGRSFFAHNIWATSQRVAQRILNNSSQQ